MVGVARLRGTTACFAAQFENIEEFKKNPAALKIKKFGSPVRARDLESFSLDKRDIEDLRDCAVGNCKVKLSAGMIEALRKQVSWSGPAPERVAEATIRQEMLGYIQRYQSEGNRSLSPQFQGYLAKYWAQPLQGVADFFYWSTEGFGLKPVTSLPRFSSTLSREVLSPPPSNCTRRIISMHRWVWRQRSTTTATLRTRGCISRISIAPGSISWADSSGGCAGWS